MEKMTKAQWYETIIGIVEASDYEDKDGAVAFLTSQADQLAAKAEKAKERAAVKKAAGDELRETVLSVLTDEPQTALDILGQIEGEDLTKAKITARLTQLINLGKAAKEQAVTEDGKRVMAYRLA